MYAVYTSVGFECIVSEIHHHSGKSSAYEFSDSHHPIELMGYFTEKVSTLPHLSVTYIRTSDSLLFKRTQNNTKIVICEKNWIIVKMKIRVIHEKNVSFTIQVFLLLVQYMYETFCND